MIFTLQNASMTARIDTIGAQLISLTDAQGQEYIWQRDPQYWSSCSPLLFPSIGNCRDGKTMIGGTWYQLAKHGFCRNAEFTVTSRTPDCATLQLCSSEETLRVYPYAFCLSLSYTLQADGIHMDYCVKNTDSRIMHYLIGAHPGFNCPLKQGERFEDYVLEFEQEETADSIKYDIPHMQFDMNCRRRALDHTRVLPLNYDLFTDDAIFFESLASRKVAIRHLHTGKGVEVSFPDFETVAFWTAMPARGPFLCVEPWNGSAIRSDEDDHFEHRHHVQSLEAGASRFYHLGIRIL